MPELNPVSASPGIRERGEGFGRTDPANPPEKGKGKDRSPTDGVELSPEALRRVGELKATDARVRAHEAAHLAAAGGLAKGGATFTYTRGPDGKQYAVGGEVAIDSGGVPGDPKATLAKAQRIQAAALAPADPSPQDRAIAAEASALAAQAAGELARGAGEAVRPEAEGAKGRRTSRAPGDELEKGLQIDLTV